MMDLPLHPLLRTLGIELPLLAAPMAGVSKPALAAAVCEARALGSIAVGASTPSEARDAVANVRALTSRPFNVNVFAHARPHRDVACERAWLERLRPTFREFDAEPPRALREIYTSFVDDDDMLAMLVATKPAIVSFHFGLPDAARIAALKSAGIRLLSTATNREEARAAERAGIDAIVAQGYEAGGHRGAFDAEAPDERLGTIALVRALVSHVGVPVVAAGGIMDGAGIAAALDAGAIAVQLGTAFVGCAESAADDAYRDALFGAGAAHTTMTRAISGRPARCLPNRFVALAASLGNAIPAYPIAYDAGKALHAAARAKGETGFGAQWAGAGAPAARALPAAELIAILRAELEAARATAR